MDGLKGVTAVNMEVAGEKIRTPEPLRDRILSPAPLTTWLPPQIFLLHSVRKLTAVLDEFPGNGFKDGPVQD